MIEILSVYNGYMLFIIPSRNEMAHSQYMVIMIGVIYNYPYVDCNKILPWSLEKFHILVLL